MTEIKTEFDVTDHVYFIDKNTIIKGEVSKIEINISFEGIEVIYSMKNGTKRDTKRIETEVFKKLEDIVEKFAQRTNI
jgi:hypothetical protein